MPFFQNSELLCHQLGWEFDPTYGVCGSSDVGMGGCLHAATWEQAEARCRLYGARLCTLSELPVNNYGGCGHDYEYVWVWESCDHSHPHQHHTAAVGLNALDKVSTKLGRTPHAK